MRVVALKNWPLPSRAPLKDTLLIGEKALINGASQSRLRAPAPSWIHCIYKIEKQEGAL